MIDSLLEAMGRREVAETAELIEIIAAATLDAVRRPVVGGVMVDLYPEHVNRLLGRIKREALPDGGWRITLLEKPDAT